MRFVSWCYYFVYKQVKRARLIELAAFALWVEPVFLVLIEGLLRGLE